MRKVVVVGVGRSGTSMLMNILFNTGFFRVSNRLFRRRKVEGSYSNYMECSRLNLYVVSPLLHASRIRGTLFFHLWFRGLLVRYGEYQLKSYLSRNDLLKFPVELLPHLANTGYQFDILRCFRDVDAQYMSYRRFNHVWLTFDDMVVREEFIDVELAFYDRLDEFSVMRVGFDGLLCADKALLGKLSRFLNIPFARLVKAHGEVVNQ